MKCPTCQGSGWIKAQAPQTEWETDLLYLARHSSPIWGGPLKRGVDMLKEDTSLAYLVDNGYAKRIGDEGFEITPKGRRVVSTMK